MATLKQDLLRSTFQENQMRLLQSIEENVDRMENRQRTLEDILSDELSNIVSKLNDIGTSIGSLPSPRSTNRNYNTNTSQSDNNDSLSDIDRRVDNIDRNIRRSLNRQTSDSLDRQRRDNDRQRDRNRQDVDNDRDRTINYRKVFEIARKSFLNSLGIDYMSREEKEKETPEERDNRYGKTLSRVLSLSLRVIQDILDNIGLSVRSLINNSNRVLQDTNSIIKNTGYSLSTIRGFRTNLKDTVDSLNQYYENSELNRSPFNYNEALDTFTTIINNSGISNMDFYDEYGELFLKTARSMNINLGRLATFSDQFYKRYSFSSSNMEELLTDIRKSSAGTAFTDEELAALMEQYDLEIATYAKNRSQQTGEDFGELFKQGSSSIQEFVTYFNDRGLSKQEATQMLGDVMSAATNPLSDAGQRYLFATGMDATDILPMLMSDPQTFYDNLFNSLANQGSTLNTNQTMSEAYSDALGLGSYGTWARRLDLNRSVGVYKTAKQFEEDNTAKVSEDPIMDLWIGYQESMTNKFSTLNEDIAKWQENTGVDLSFIEQIYNLLKPLFSSIVGIGIGSFFTRLLTSGGSGTLLGSLGGSSGGLLGSLGPIAVAVAAVGTAVYGIKDVLDQRDKELSNEYEGILDTDNIQLGEGQTYGYGVTGSKVKDDGTIETTYGTIATDNDIDYSYYQDMLTQFNRETEERTGLKTLDDIEGGYDLGNRVVNIGRAMAGTGYWKKNAKWYDYVPVIGGLINTISWRKDYDTTLNNDGTSNDQRARDYNDFYRFLNVAKDNPELEVLFNFYKSTGILSDTNSQQLGVFSRSYDTIYDSLKNGGLVLDIQGFLDGQNSDQYWHNLEEFNLSSPYNQGEIQYDQFTGEHLTQNTDTIDVNSFDIGANEILDDQLALVHAGEAIIPSTYNPFNSENYERLFNPEISRTHDLTVEKFHDLFTQGIETLTNTYHDLEETGLSRSDTNSMVSNMLREGWIPYRDNTVTEGYIPESSDGTTEIYYTKGLDTPDIISAINTYRPEVPKDYSDKRDQDHDDIIENLTNVLKSMDTIYRFLSQWKEDNYTREDLKDAQNNKKSGGGGEAIDATSAFGMG